VDFKDITLFHKNNFDTYVSLFYFIYNVINKLNFIVQ